MTERRPLLLIFLVATFCLSGCAGSPAEHVAADKPTARRGLEPQRVPHPLSYQPILLAAHAEKPELIDVGFERRYDVFCMLFPEQPTVYRDCRILGTTDRDGLASRESSLFSKSSGWEPGRLFDDMLVLETADGRLAYIPPGSVRYIEESATNGQQYEASPRTIR